jgi:hypothetical protein
MLWHSLLHDHACVSLLYGIPPQLIESSSNLRRGVAFDPRTRLHCDMSRHIGRRRSQSNASSVKTNTSPVHANRVAMPSHDLWTGAVLPFGRNLPAGFRPCRPACFACLRRAILTESSGEPSCVGLRPQDMNALGLALLLACASLVCAKKKGHLEPLGSHKAGMPVRPLVCCGPRFCKPIPSLRRNSRCRWRFERLCPRQRRSGRSTRRHRPSEVQLACSGVRSSEPRRGHLR